ncbi:hypothetical protein D088_090007 [Salmonella enterica subsp. houtenae serovar 16:z4,z32:-- str. RKS3027]|nr:hypothetical protein D088_090007 [Salmonella enterica subsp. houtenae serovar 16:z4,z32:-- str. RKS3027]
MAAETVESLPSTTELSTALLTALPSTKALLADIILLFPME